MGKGNNGRYVFPLTGLQIGDLQSYLSDISLFLANDSKKLYILVDNRPWLRDLGSRGAHFWQLMVTKSRLSPFANTKARGEKKEVYISSSSKEKEFQRWFSLIYELMLSRKKILLPVKNLTNSLQFNIELRRTLYGFIVFEVAWSNVCGINYLNELQIDTSLYIEAKVMKRWEFDNIAQAANCMSSWFSGTLSEQLQLKEHLDSTIGDIFYDACEDLSATVLVNVVDDDDDDDLCNCLNTTIEEYSNSIGQTSPPPSGSYKRRKVMNSFSDKPLIYSETSTIEATQYRDVLIYFRFNDHYLPFKLREVIVFDLRLLTLLEAGLPSWVIFLQSYPMFCNLYRPWMCPLARVLYVIISLVTVLIGLYDLYKNVPILKATASHLCGPFFDWIESWDMVSRVKYLGTMLFLHNFQKAFRWCLALANTSRSFFLVLVQPLANPLSMLFGFLLPTLNILFEVIGGIFCFVWDVIETSCNIVGFLLELLFLPFWFIFTVVWRIVDSILCPIFWIFGEILYAPIRILLTMSSFLASIYTYMSEILGDTWQFVSSIFQLASSSEVTVSTNEVSMWRALWNDLFSQIFRALKIILNGFLEFVTACNRHRLSIYNYLQEFAQRLCQQCQLSHQVHLRDDKSTCVTPHLVEERKKTL